MEWYYYFSGFWAGAFFSNFIPHYVKGICGDKFPTPFSKPPGRGLSTALVNVIWSLVNLIIAYILFRVGKVSSNNIVSLVIFFIGFAVMSIMHGINFAKKHKE